MAAATQTRFDLAIPPKEELKGKPFIPAPGIANLADRVIDKHSDVLGPLADFSVDYLWKSRGGSSHGKPRFAGTVQASALVRFYSDRHFIVYFAADHLRDLKVALTEEQYEALLFRELLKIGQQENTGSPLIKGYDVQTFHAEMERYGAWEADLAELLKQGHEAPQIALFTFGDDDEETSSNATTAEDANEEGSSNVVPFDVDPPRNGRPHSEADLEAERALKNRGKGAE